MLPTVDPAVQDRCRLVELARAAGWHERTPASLLASSAVTHAWRRGFSTLGCLDLSLDDVGRLAGAHGITGIELRVGLSTLPSPTEVRAVLSRHGVTAFAVASSARIADPDTADEASRVLRADVAYATGLGASYVRVFPGGSSAATAAGHLTELANLLEQPGSPTLALETHDRLPTGAAVAAFLTEVGHPRLGVVWDVLHPWRHGESIAETAEALSGRPGYVQVKDAVSAEDPTPCLLGTGAVPLADLRDHLGARGYDGWVSIEWERAWYPDIPPLATVLTDTAGW